jgi:hypothetical protein
MKAKSTFSAMLLAILSMLFSATVQANNSDLYLILKNDGSIPTDRDFRVVVQLNIPQSTFLQVSPANTQAFGDVVGSFKTGSCKDGKVDVDIIIRGGSLKPIINAGINEDEIKIKLFVCEVITVDNISGVYQASGSGNASNVARVLKTSVDVSSESEGTSGISSIPILGQNAIRAELFSSAASSNAKSTAELVLFPNPVTDGFLNIKGNETLVAGVLSIHNALGATVSTVMVSEGEQLLQIPVDKLAKGVYYARVQTVSGLVIKKFNVTR